MAFFSEAQKAVKDPATPREDRLTLEFLLANAAGRANARPIDDILRHLHDNGIDIGPSKFQTTILADSRVGDIFIGSGQKGYYLIEDEDDARATLDFYEARIASEMQRIKHLKELALSLGWSL